MITNEKSSLLKIIRTIDDDQEVHNFSEDSDVEVEFQPIKQKDKRNTDFDTSFQFVSSVDEYNKDSWNDIMKYVKRKAKSKTDDKIKRIKLDNEEEEKDIKDENTEIKYESDNSLSDDELKHDKIKIKEKKNKGKSKNDEKAEKEFYENVDVNTDNSSFYQMNLSRPLLKAIGEMNFIHPTPIQAATIPVALLGKDICGCAATGTGKTAAYMLPTLERLLYRPAGSVSVTRVLILVPTRELGVQVYQVTKQLCQFTNIQIGLAVGGLDLKVQENILRKNPDIVIATPGRLIDHLKSTPTFGLESIEILILDEADRMLDEYFAEQMKEIIKQCSRTRQTMLFSATMTEEVQSLAAVSLVKPVKLFVDSNRDVAFNLRQEFIRIRSDREADREPILAALVCRTFRERCMIFVQTKKQAHRLHILLGLLDVHVGELHGNLTQPQRLDALEKFKTKQFDILVATDVAARGLDIPNVQTVINFVMPATTEYYIHRVGRTARAGRAGVSISLAGEQERKIIKDVIKKAKNPVKSRVIPPDIIQKYKSKIEKLESKISQILKEEHEERLLSKTENQANRIEKLLKDEKDEKRPWFQTKKERKEEKERLSLKSQDQKSKKKTNKKENIKTKSKDPKSSEVKERNEVNKLVLLQAKLAKKKFKQKKINTIVEDKTERGTKKRGKKRSNFDSNIYNISQKASKKLRYECTKKIKNKPKKGKAFGRAKSKKRK